MAQRKNQHPSLKRVYCYLPLEVDAELEKAAADKYKLKHEIIRDIIIEYLELEEK